MMPAHSTARSPSPTSRRSLLSYVKAPFGVKTRHFSEFFIQPDDPHRVYGPGDVVTGSVILKVTKPFSVTHITVRLHGFSQVYKAPNSPGEAQKQYNAALAAGKSRRSGGYYGNGFLSLFEDEITLCGDGRLKEGTYQFNFELVFPRDHLPSSIDFERGTVSYVIAATMTRPTTISPTSTCERKVNFQEDIDVALLTQPKPRVITLEPLVRRTKTKHKIKKAAENTGDKSAVDSTDTVTTETATNDRMTDVTGSQSEVDPPQSPVPSDVSFESCLSSGTGSAIDSAAPSARTGESRRANGKLPHVCSHDQKPISVTIGLQKAGVLRGDQIQVKVFLTHTRPIKSLRGIILTLYRQARVDMHPALPLVRNGVNDPNPRTRSGLSGLSLSSGGSTHTYRKDLDQQFASLLVNPATLTAEVKANLRIPEEAFPSIANVPGAMISFKYYIEIILDIQGRLAGLDKYLPSVGPLAGANNGQLGEASGGVGTPWGGRFIDTEDLRREKGVVYSVFEVVVGTRDSERRSNWTPQETDVSTITGREEISTDGTGLQVASEPSETNGSSFNGEHGHRPLSWDQYWSHHPPDQPPHEPPPAMDFPPPPEIESEQHLSEKQRAERAEARLLPSAPPESRESSSRAQLHAPSAPVLLNERPLPPLPPVSPPGFDFGMSTPTAPPSHGLTHLEITGEPSAPAYDHNEPPLGPITDDKEELRRQRLEMERSAPQETHEDENEDAGQGPSAPPPFASAPSVPSVEDFAPSAPSAHQLTEHAQFGFEAQESQHILPRYER